MSEIRQITCPFCGWQGPVTGLSKHLRACTRRRDALIVPPADVIAEDGQWFAEHPNCWTLRRRIRPAEKVVYRERYGIPADTPIHGYVVVLRPYRYDDPRDMYSYKYVRVGVANNAEGS